VELTSGAGCLDDGRCGREFRCGWWWRGRGEVVRAEESRSVEQAAVEEVVERLVEVKFVMVVCGDTHLLDMAILIF
jgi:hypothetical protein